MSSFNNKGLRKDKIRTQVKHLNSFYSILDQLEEVYQRILKEELDGERIVTNDNFTEVSTSIMGRELDSIEVMVLKGKLGLETKLKINEQGDNV